MQVHRRSRMYILLDSVNVTVDFVLYDAGTGGGDIQLSAKILHRWLSLYPKVRYTDLQQTIDVLPCLFLAHDKVFLIRIEKTEAFAN